MAVMGEDFTRRVAAEIRAEIARQGMTQDQLAAKTGISQSSLSRRLTAAYPFSTSEIAAIADALGVPATSFFGSPASAA